MMVGETTEGPEAGQPASPRRWLPCRRRRIAWWGVRSGGRGSHVGGGEHPHRTSVTIRDVLVRQLKCGIGGVAATWFAGMRPRPAGPAESSALHLDPGSGRMVPVTRIRAFRPPHSGTRRVRGPGGLPEVVLVALGRPRLAVRRRAAAARALGVPHAR